MRFPRKMNRGFPPQPLSTASSRSIVNLLRPTDSVRIRQPIRPSSSDIHAHHRFHP